MDSILKKHIEDQGMISLDDMDKYFNDPNYKKEIDTAAENESIQKNKIRRKRTNLNKIIES